MMDKTRLSQTTLSSILARKKPFYLHGVGPFYPVEHVYVISGKPIRAFAFNAQQSEGIYVVIHKCFCSSVFTENQWYNLLSCMEDIDVIKVPSKQDK